MKVINNEEHANIHNSSLVWPRSWYICGTHRGYFF